MRQIVEPKKRIISFLPVLFMMVLIFGFSSQNSDVSGAQSSGITKELLEDIGRLVPSLKAQWNPSTFELIETIVRKLAHCTEYALLGISLNYHLHVCGNDKRRRILKSIFWGVFYAATDEFHQLFVSGRSGQFSDVCIDGIGVLLGSMIFLVSLNLKNRIGQRKKHFKN